MGIENLIVFLAIGIAAGWIAGNLMKGKDFGLVGNLVLGVAGAFIGGFLFNLIGITSDSLIESFITAVIGAVVLLGALGVRK